MSEVVRFETVAEFNALNKHKTLHPLVSVIDLAKADPRESRRVSYGFYTVFFKKIVCGDLRYGLDKYDYQEGTLIFLAPGQVIGENIKGNFYQPQGQALIFHEDLIHGTQLGRHIGDYSFFSYEVREALHLSENEREIIRDCFSKIEFELSNGVDKHSKKLITANIQLFLDYCLRFYDRQFITRETVNKGAIERFDDLLAAYFQSDKPHEIGLPTVSYFAAELHLSANYFGDLIKKETGTTAQEYIQLKLINLAKSKMFDQHKSVNEIAYELGFKYPQHFSRLFKQRTGYTPNEYRKLN